MENIILERFRPPIKMTSCGHSFCERCILAACPEPSDWQCPMCNQVHDHPASTLPRNFLAEQIIESAQAQPPPKPVRLRGVFGRCNVHRHAITLCKFREYKLQCAYNMESILYSFRYFDVIKIAHNTPKTYVSNVLMIRYVVV